jgi:glycosyltransferase involved in cell wall biosynthesis
MKVLFVAAHPPLPLDNGGRLRTFHLLDELCARAEVFFTCLDREPGSGMAPCPEEAIRLALPGLRALEVVPAPPARKRLRQLRALALGGSYTERMFHTPELVAAVRQGMQRFEPDIVHCDSLFCAYAHPVDAPAATAPWVLSMHNSESLLKHRLAETATEWPRRRLYRAEAEALGELERRWLTAYDHCLAVSDAERERFARLNPSTVTVPNGVEPLPEPGLPTAPGEGEPLRLLFVGSLNYEPNRDGLEWFAHEVAPRVRERVRIEIEAVGPGARGPELPGVSYLGRVEDLGPVYERAHAAVVPLRAGAGSRLKVLEALARGVPLVSTTIGVEGFDLHDGEQALIADDPDAIAERIALLDASLRGGRNLAKELVDAGYHFAHRYFWPAIGERLAATYEAWVAESQSSSTAS